jgi:hypothetical protein
MLIYATLEYLWSVVCIRWMELWLEWMFSEWDCGAVVPKLEFRALVPQRVDSSESPS